MSALGIPIPIRAVTNSGATVSTYKVYGWVPDSSGAPTATPRTFYTDAALATPASNPATLGASTRVIYKSPSTSIVIVIKSADDAITYSTEYYPAEALNVLGTGVAEHLAENLLVFYPRDATYGATGDGSTADDTAIAACIAAAKSAGGWMDGEGLTYALTTLQTLTGAGTYNWRNIKFKKPTQTSTDYEWTFTITGQDFGTAINLAANAAIGANSITLASASGIAAGQKYLLISNADYNPDPAGYGNTVARKSEWVRVAPTYVSGVVIPLSTPLQSSYATADTARVYRFYEDCEVRFDDVEFIGGGAAKTQGGIRFNKATIHKFNTKSTANEYEGVAFNLCSFKAPVHITGSGSNLSGYGYLAEFVGCDAPLGEVHGDDIRHVVTMGSSYQTTLPGGGGDRYILGRGGNITAVSGPSSRGSVFDTHTGHIGCAVGGVTGSLTGGTIQTFTASSSSGLLLTFGTDMPQGAAFTVSNAGGALPTGLAGGTTYYTIRVSASTCRVATSAVNAAAGTAIAYTDAGSGTHTLTTATLQEAVTIESHGFDIRSIQVKGADLGLTVQNYGRPTDEPSPTVTFGSVDLGRGGVSTNALMTVENRDAATNDELYVAINNLQGDYPGILTVDAEKGDVNFHADFIVAQARAYHGINAVGTALGRARVQVGEAHITDNSNSASFYLAIADGTNYEAVNPGEYGAQIIIGGGHLVSQQTALKADDGLIDLDNTVEIDATTVSNTTGIGLIARDQPVPIGSSVATTGGRLTAVTGSPVTTSDQTAVATIYFAPHVGDLIPIWDGVDFKTVVFSQLSLALNSNSGHTGYHQSGKVFDVFVYMTNGVPTLGTGPAWTNSTTRASDITRKRGVWVNTASITIRFGTASGDTVTVAANKATYVGTIYATANGQTEDSNTTRGIWNMYNRRKRSMRRMESTDSWNYSTAAWQQANASTANQLAYVRGLNEDAVSMRAISLVNSSGATMRGVKTGIGLDATNAIATGCLIGKNVVDTEARTTTAEWNGFPGLGYFVNTWLEYAAGSDTQTWYGDNGTATHIQTGIIGEVYA